MRSDPLGSATTTAPVIGGWDRHGLAAGGLADEYIATEDRETLVGVTVETEAAIEVLDDILAVPELGFVFIGPLDLSVSLGHPGEIDHPVVQDAVETVRESAVDVGVPVAGLGFGMDDVTEKAANGYQMLNLGSTTGALEQTITRWLEASKRAHR